jgi:serine-type D-Ala-D-Ala carboxypeptidase/endopeptidase (penicillin-binding protein 4)
VTLLRRLLLPGLLGVVAVFCAVMALRAGPPPGPDGSDAGAVAAADAPVLSARRLPSVLARAVSDRRLEEGLADVIAVAPEPTCLTVGIEGRTVFASSPDVPLTPASTLKLVTARAVLAELDPEGRFRTAVVAAGPPAGGIVEGDLWFVGGGDPILATAAWAQRFPRQPALTTSLDALADRVRDAGVVEVRGAVVGDETRYDAQRYVPTWPDRYRAAGQTGPLSALSVDDGFLWPGGTAFPDPATGAAAVLTRLLQERGIVVGGPPRSGTAPAGADVVASIESPPLADVVGHMLRESDNGSAELLLKELGLQAKGEGSTTAGIAAATRHLEASGLPVDGFRMLDGSGLDPENRLTCRLLQDILDGVEPDDPIDAGLPVGGRSGTLTSRFLDDTLVERVRAKTGSIRAVAALAGFVEEDGDPTLTFSYVVNGLPLDADAGPLYDAVARVLVDHPDAPDLAELGPSAYPAPA